jgi:hypothetical protein
MNDDYRRYNPDWLMRQLEDQLARADMAGEGDYPDWLSF